MFLVSVATAAQPEMIRCLPPQVPVTDLPEAVLLEYRAEIGAEFESYFIAISTHIACLDEERTRALTEARTPRMPMQLSSTFPQPRRTSRETLPPCPLP
ncbi:hypothetical protein [Cypionkella psychrotolerans]|uniref:hypothetical protein n=1 Tax=Cypionkella psychrotolerans TaxID=1678131 RepID=UPI000AEDCBE8|nr:hypothetical protein [Cypionkella psychrotolerans]